jgi:hypothetical protein
MHATKRKFDELLQRLGTAPGPTSLKGLRSSSDASLVESDEALGQRMAADLDILTKRRRVATPSSRTNGASPASTTPPSKPAASSSNVSSVGLRNWTPNGAVRSTAASGTPSKPTEAARYCPGDRGQLIRRLASFQELTEWTPKPERISEIEWAKRGWECKGKERVRCVLCDKELVVRLHRKDTDGREVPILIPAEVEDALVEKYAELTITAHVEECLWRKRGCDSRPTIVLKVKTNHTDAVVDSLLRIPVYDPKAVLADLRQRYDELLSRKDALPYEFNLKLPSGLEIGKALSYLPSDFFGTVTEGQDPTTPNRTALALALLGWQSLSNPRTSAPVHNSASCHTCLRRLGLWMFKSKEVDLETNAVITPAAMDYLDPLLEHRFFCPWKNAAAQNPGSGSTPNKDKFREDKPAWELVVEMLRDEAHLRDRAAAAPGHGRTKSAASAAASVPGIVVDVDNESQYTDDNPAAREAKDKERWARLRRVKSFFQKDGKKLKRLSRPGTSASSVHGGA